MVYCSLFVKCIIFQSLIAAGIKVFLKVFVLDFIVKSFFAFVEFVLMSRIFPSSQSHLFEKVYGVAPVHEVKGMNFMCLSKLAK